MNQPQILNWIVLSVVALSWGWSWPACGQSADPAPHELGLNRPSQVQHPDIPAAQIANGEISQPLSGDRPDELSELLANGGDSLANGGDSLADLLTRQTAKLTSRTGISSTIKAMLLLAMLSLAPAIVLMTTCYVRVIVVLGLLRHAFGTQQLPPTQVLTALSMFITLLVMTPVWNQVKQQAIDPYTRSEQPISWEDAWQRALVPVKDFMSRQIELADNTDAVALFYKYLSPSLNSARPTAIEQVPINVLLPAFIVSELKVAFMLGFQIYLPFLVLDLVVSTMTVLMGMLMLPPTVVSFPLKLILFVLVDGWNLVVGMLLQSFGPFS